MRNSLYVALTVVLTAAAPLDAQEKVAVKVLIITGDHGHDWRKTTPFLKELLEKAGHKVDVTESPSKDLTADNLTKYQVLLLNYRNTPKGAKENPASVWSDDNKKAFTEAVKGGVGLVVYHHASAAFVGDSAFDKEFEKIIAGGWRKQGFHGKMHEFTVTVRKEHPITKGISEFKHGRDELYQNSLITPGSEVLATAYSVKEVDPKNTGKHEPILWVSSFGKGRVVNNALGHDVEAMQSAGFKTLMIRGVEWAATGRVIAQAPKVLGLDEKILADPQAAETAAAIIEAAYHGKPQPENVRMLLAILRGSKMGPNSGWFGPSQTRYTWKWLAEAHGIDPATDTISRKSFKGTDAAFACLDRDKDGVVSSKDLDWSGMIRPKDGSPPKAKGKDTPMPPMLKQMILKGFFDGDIGSWCEGPQLGDPAPDFTLPVPDGKKSIALSQSLGKKPIVLVFGSFT